MQLCANSDCCDVKRSLGTNVACFFLLQSGYSHSVHLLRLYTNFLHHNLLQVILFAAIFEKRAMVNATTDHTGIWDTCSRQEVM